MSRKFHMLRLFLVLLILGVVFPVASQNKREFRGAWIQCVNGQFQGVGTANMQRTLKYQLDELKKDGVNAIFFQVRAECDALYPSRIEPWSRFLSGTQGVAPYPYWDPLQWMIEQCHARGMELHAWINPYRAKTKSTASLSGSHIAVREPGRFFKYDGQYILNPGMASNRKYICSVVEDILKRYDVDGIHMDDYFYPYPAPGEVIPDAGLFRANSNGISNIADWRRFNVNLFINEVSDLIKKVKPWVKFGVSPFGIYRNSTSSPTGSATRGLQNYDDLYADVLFWINNGWIDYCVPQIYWQIGHPTADYKTLLEWWNHYAGGRHLYIGEDVERTAKYADLDNPRQNQMPDKFALRNSMYNVKGAVLWYAKAVVDNVGNYGKALRHNYWKYPALPPLMPFIDGKAPKKVRKLKTVWTSDGYMLFWTQPKAQKWGDVAVKYVVYRFADGEKIDISNPAKIVGVTSQTFFKMPYESGKEKFVYVVTALDRLSNESKIKKKSVRL